MATQAEVEQVRRALNRLSQSARSDWQQVWGSMRASDRVMANRALANGWTWVLERYGDMAATLAADFFEVQAADLALKTPRVAVAPGVNAERATARLGWALSTQNQMGNMLTLVDELVKQPYRSTIQDSSWVSGAAWARVPTGAETCSFCLMLASRGAVYRTQARAGDRRYGKRYHGDCDCTAVLVRGPQDYPEGYDPDGLYDQYLLARRDAGSGDPKQILAAMRERFDTN